MFSADASSLRSLGKELRKSKPDVYRELRRELLAEGHVIAEDAKGLADWSTKIPDSIKVGMSGISTVVVRAGGKAAPDATPYEHAGASGTFRHPVFPDPAKTRSEWTWVTQEARPFLHPAALDRLDATVENLGAAVQRAVDRLVEGE